MQSPKLMAHDAASGLTSIKVTEEELRFQIQEIYEQKLKQEFGRQDELLMQVMELQKDNLRLQGELSSVGA